MRALISVASLVFTVALLVFLDRYVVLDSAAKGQKHSTEDHKVGFVLVEHELGQDMAVARAKKMVFDLCERAERDVDGMQKFLLSRPTTALREICGNRVGGAYDLPAQTRYATESIFGQALLDSSRKRMGEVPNAEISEVAHAR